MTEVYRYERPIQSVFELLGEDEQALTDSLGWALAKSPELLHEFLARSCGIDCGPDDLSDATVHLQRSAVEGGFTDIEIKLPGMIHLIVEAKKGWILPTEEQLRNYRPRFRNDPVQAFVVLTEASEDYARRSGLSDHIEGIPVKQLTWGEILNLAETARRDASHAGKRMLDELIGYLGRATQMRRVDSNWVYVVALSYERPEWSGLSFVDIVRGKNLYFHPYEKNWPAEPPNYMGFRYDGRLQSIHYVEDYEITKDLSTRIPEIRAGFPGEDFFLYHLGPAIVPPGEVRSGNLFGSARVWCILDTLLTSPTVADAIRVSEDRIRSGRWQRWSGE